MLQLSAPASFMRAMFAEAAGMHASAIRLDVAPSLVFTAPSQPPDFSGLDEVVTLARQYHLRVIGDLFTVPSWIADCQSAADMSNMGRCGTGDLGDYRSMIAQIVGRADPVIRDWEIWNEPDSGAFFTGTPQQYAQMLRAAYDTIKGLDPQANVLLGGISGTSGMSWLTQVFATPGADARHAFDIANVHERGRLDALAPDITSWKQFLAASGFTGPLWVTEHGYPADPAYQYDPGFASGLGSQAAYLAASIPTLIDAGADEVFVTERDDLSGQFASEGVLGGDVFDPPVADPQVIESPAYSVVRAIAGCYEALGRDCPGAAPAASPASLVLPPTRLGSATVTTVTMSDPGTAPLRLGEAELDGESPDPITFGRDNCSNQILEPDQTCSVALRFAPAAGGAALAALQLPSDGGTITVPVTAVTPSVSSLTPPPLFHPVFTATGATNRVGQIQRLELSLTNPLSAPVYIASSELSGPAARRFLIDSDHCSRVALAPGATCRLSVHFAPARTRAARAVLTLRGDGTPLRLALRGTPFAPPALTRLATLDRNPCFARSSRNRVLVAIDQPAAVSWQIVRRQHATTPRCGGGAAPQRAPARSNADGRLVLSGRSGSFALPTVLRGLEPGAYLLTVSASNAHGTGQAKTMWLTL